MVVEQVLTEGLAIHTFRDANCGEGGQSALGRHMHRKAETFQPVPEHLRIAAMACPGLVETFFSQETQGLTHAEVHVDRRGVVVDAVAAPVLVQQGNVQIPVGHLALTGCHLGLSTGAHGEGSETGRAAQALLAAAVGEIDFPLIDVERNAPQRGDGVEQQKAIMLPAEVADALHGLADTR